MRIRTNRIDALVEQINNIKFLLDIGCDHGLVIKKAFLNKKIVKAIAADINIKPLNMAKENLENFDNVKFHLSDGFKNIKEDDFDGVLISGMGALSIENILKDAPKRNIKFILQPNSKVEILRNYLSENGFKIIDEIVVFEKFYYIILVVIYGNLRLSEKDIFLGPILQNKQNNISYYEYLLEKEIAINKAKKTSKKSERIIWLEKLIKKKRGK